MREPVYDNFTDLIDRIFQYDMDHSAVNCPAANISEQNDAYLIEMAIPGYRRENVSIELDNKQLHIKGKREEGDDEAYTRREFGLGDFSRSFLIPGTANTEKIEAKFSDGILSVRIAKKDEAIPRPPRQIDIK